MNLRIAAHWISSAFIAILLVPTVAMCKDTPEFYGVYALDKGKLIELKDESQYYKFHSDVKFILYEPNMDAIINNIKIKKLIFARNLYIGSCLTCTCNPKPTPYNKWIYSNESPVNIGMKPVPHQQAQVYVVPR